MANIAVLGCGNFGYQLSNVISLSPKTDKIYPTTKSEKTIKKFVLEFPLMSKDNKHAVKESNLICICVRPDQTTTLLDEIDTSLTDEKILINFTTKQLSTKYPLIQTATWITENRIEHLLYEPNDQVTEQQLSNFSEYFFPITDNFTRCTKPLIELADMSQIYAHLANYCSILIRNGMEKDTALAYMESTISGLKRSTDIEKDIKIASTKGGLTEAALSNHDYFFDQLVTSESRAVLDRLRQINC